ncbi:MAG: polysaccharide deacetylase family protein [Clostridia bacterium]|nr:polysaccharide deacetylase family protein [Clostridia bacterium]
MIKFAKKSNKKSRKILFAVLPFKKCVALIIGIVISILVCFSFFKKGGILGVNATERLVPIYSVDREDKVLAISFDCAWGVDYTDKLLSVMQEENIKCTFFMVEFWAEKYPEYVKKIFDYGHEIGTHSATHPHMNKLSESAIYNELFTSKGVIENITGKKVELFRAPFGEYSNKVISVANSLELYTIQWDVDSLDWKDLSATEITERVVKRVKNGSIVLFHNQGKHTAEALPNIIKTLKEKGYKFLPIGELIYKENYKILQNGVQAKL